MSTIFPEHNRQIYIGTTMNDGEFCRGLVSSEVEVDVGLRNFLSRTPFPAAEVFRAPLDGVICACARIEIPAEK
jgi:hypothetical protein